MKRDRKFLAVTGRSLVRAVKVVDQWQLTHQFEGMKINSIVQDPQTSETIYMGTQLNGVHVSHDAGANWESIGLTNISVKSLVVDPQNPQRLFAGCKPVSLFVSENGGQSWSELDALRETRKWWWLSPADPPGMAPYVSGLAVSPTDPDVILAGIEAGAVMRSQDGGMTWSKHLKGSDRDCHSLKFHTSNGDWAYEGGGMTGVALSQDGGLTWRKPKEGLRPKYGWMVASDPERPEIWYLSASQQSNLLKGEFGPTAHIDGRAQAHIYRKIGDAPWEQLSGGLPEPLDYMAYSLVTLPDEPAGLYAGLANGDVWHSGNYGDDWHKLPFSFDGIHPAMIVI